MVIFTGAQASGKSSFYRAKYFESHVRINLDMLRTRHRETALIRACLESSQPFVVDNTNPKATDRERYFELASGFNMRKVGFYFQSSIQMCISRNQGRAVRQKFPDHAIASTVLKLELPSFKEGFSELGFVRIVEGKFIVEAWKQ